MVVFRLSPKAKEDFKNIGRYTKNEWGTTQRNKYLAKLDNRFQWLAENPHFGTERNEVEEGYLSYFEGSHTIFYRISDENIEIIGIPHQKEDVIQHFQN